MVVLFQCSVNQPGWLSHALQLDSLQGNPQRLFFWKAPRDWSAASGLKPNNWKEMPQRRQHSNALAALPSSPRSADWTLPLLKCRMQKEKAQDQQKLPGCTRKRLSSAALLHHTWSATYTRHHQKGREQGEVQYFSVLLTHEKSRESPIIGV